MLSFIDTHLPLLLVAAVIALVVQGGVLRISKSIVPLGSIMSHNIGLISNIVQTYHILSPWGIRKGQNPLCCYILATTVLAYMIFSWWKGFRCLVNLEAALQSIGWTRRTSQECNCCPRGCFGGPPQELEMWQIACEERCSPKSIPFLISSGEAWHLSLNLLTMCLVLNCYEISSVLDHL